MGVPAPGDRIWTVAYWHPSIIAVQSKQMRFRIAVAMALLLLAMPVACVLAGSSPSHPCCPHQKQTTTLRCPYDLFDASTAASLLGAIAAPPPQIAGFAPQIESVAFIPAPLAVEDTSDILLLYRILRV